MTIEAITDNPQQLVNAIDKALKEETLKTWKKVEDANNHPYYSHTPEQWEGKVLVKPTILITKVRFHATYWSSKPEPTQEIKGYVFGRFTEVLLVHFRHYFTKLETTP